MAVSEVLPSTQVHHYLVGRGGQGEADLAHRGDGGQSDPPPPPLPCTGGVATGLLPTVHCQGRSVAPQYLGGQLVWALNSFKKWSLW